MSLKLKQDGTVDETEVSNRTKPEIREEIARINEQVDNVNSQIDHFRDKKTELQDRRTALKTVINEL